MDFPKKARYSIDDLLEIIQLLRGENGCPWDRKQDHHSIRRNLLEEAYEAVEAIDLEDPILLKEELGDLLMQVVFHASLEEDVGHFSFDDVCDAVCRKLIVRHPHVFSSVTGLDDPDIVLQNWEAIKRETKGQASVTESLYSVPALPALMKSEKIQSRAAKAGFDPFTESFLKNDLTAEWEQLANSDAEEEKEQLLANLFFHLVALCRKWKIDPEQLLSLADNRFIEQFSYVEEQCRRSNRSLSELSDTDITSLWKEAASDKR